MKVILSHQSAMDYWLSHEGTKRTLALFSEDVSANLAAIREALIWSDFSDKEVDKNLHVLVLSDSKRRNKKITCHVINYSLPHESFCAISAQLAVVCPELNLVQMASELSFVELVEYGCQLCAQYYIDLNSGNLIARKPLCTSKSIMRYLSKMQPESKAVATIKRALHYIVENAASPMEHKAAIIFSLPHKWGGFGLPTPCLNQKIELSDKSQTFCKKNYCYADLCWTESKLIVEYDSALWHNSLDRYVNDAARRDALRFEGWYVYELVPDVLYNPTKMEHLAKQLSNKLGLRFRNRSECFQDKNQELMKLLLEK